MILCGTLFKANLRIWGRCWTGRRTRRTFPRLIAGQVPRSSGRHWTASSSGPAPPRPRRRVCPAPARSSLGGSEVLRDGTRSRHGSVTTLCCLVGRVWTRRFGRPWLQQHQPLTSLYFGFGGL